MGPGEDRPLSLETQPKPAVGISLFLGLSSASSLEDIPTRMFGLFGRTYCSSRYLSRTALSKTSIFP